MEERGNKTIMCSVLFLDIVEYSKKSVTGQISLKDRFNTYLSNAIQGVPLSDRIILDTGDGAAINFLGDVEDALKAALSLRTAMLNEDADIDPPLLVRIGINLGPVRLVRDINGQPNIVGDGINVAQRVMGFADASQILVSRSYYDAVSRLSHEYAGMFHYQGSRTDKHVREHEVYAIGYPGDKTQKHVSISAAGSEIVPVKNTENGLSKVKQAWTGSAAKLDALISNARATFMQAEPKQRALYAAVVGVPVLIFAGVMAIKSLPPSDTEIAPAVVASEASSAVQSVSAAVASVDQSVKTIDSATNAAKPEDKPKEQVLPAPKTKTDPALDKKLAADKAKNLDAASKKESRDVANKKAVETPAQDDPPVTVGYLSVSCVDVASVFVDGAQKGKVNSGQLTVSLLPGKHAVIVMHPTKGVYSQSVEIELGKTVRVKPGYCN